MLRRTFVRAALAAAIAAPAVATPIAASAQETTLRLVSAFPENSIYVQAPGAVDQKRVNAEGKGVAADQLHRRPEGDPDLRGRQRGEDRRGRHGDVHRRVLHQRHARGRRAQAHPGARSPSSARTAPSTLINKVWNEKGNMQYLARMVENQPFHLYLNKKIDKPDLTGLKIRITPVYRDFFQALGANVMHHAARRGLHRARARRGRRLRLADRRHLRPQLAGEDQVPRRPRLLRRRGVADHEPRPPTRSSAEAQRDYLNKQVLALESRKRPSGRAYTAEEIERQAQAGIQTIKFDAGRDQGLASTRPTRRPGRA